LHALPDSPVRILHIAESVKGGCGTYINQLVRAQLADPAIERVHVVLPDAHVLQVPDIPEANRTLFSSRGRSLASLHALWRTTARELQAFRPDCVHLHSTFAGAVGRIGMALRRSRPSIVYCAHGWAFDIAGSPIKRGAMALAERLLSHGCEGVIAISEYERKRGIAIGIAPERIVTVLNGIADAASERTTPPALSHERSSGSAEGCRYPAVCSGRFGPDGYAADHRLCRRRRPERARP
jgi:hypothetical protein